MKPRSKGAARMFAACAVLLCLTALPAAAQQRGRIQGRVTTTAGGRPLAGAQVFIPGTGFGALTDAEGRYTISAVPVGPATLRVQMIGFAGADKSTTVPADGVATVDFTLAESAVALDEVVVTGTAAQSRRKEVGNSIAAIGAAQIEKLPIATPQDVLQGRTAGITVLNNGGHPGAGGMIRLRGINSVSQGNDPIVYVDGVRIFNEQVQAGGDSGGHQTLLPLNDINAQDIERIEVVKGAAATTLYGTEASGGVIQIFTKKGASGAPVWNAEITGGFNSMGHVGPKEDPTGLFMNECSGANHHYLNLTTGQFVPFVDVTCPSSGTYLQKGPVQRYALSVRGGVEKMTYFLSGNFNGENGVTPSAWNRDGGFRGNFSFFPTSTLQLQLNSAYTRRKVRWLGDGDNSEGFTLNVIRAASSYLAGGKGDACSVVPAGQTCVSNAEAFTVENYSNVDHFTTGLTIGFNPIEKLMNRFTVGFDYNDTQSPTIVPFGFIETDLSKGFLQDDDRRHTKLSLDYAGSFRNDFGKTLQSTFSWGGQLFDDRDRWVISQSQDFAGPGEPTLKSGAIRDITQDDQLRVVNAGFFLQELLGWKDRLFVTAGLRVDGNSAFGSQFGLQPYPKISASYVLSDHTFWPKWWETMKLRAAVGESGKAPGAFDAVRTWNPISYVGNPGFRPNQLGNADLGPERTRELEAGFDASMFQGRLGLEATYFNARTNDALIGVTFPPSNGFLNTQLQNVGTIGNHGGELSVNAGLLRTSNLDWRLRVNGSITKSKAIDLGGQELYTGANTYAIEGHALPMYVGSKVTNPDAIADPIYEDNAVLAQQYPDRILGVGTTITVMKRLTLDVLGEGQYGGHLENDVAWNQSFRGTWAPCFDVQQKMIAAKNGDAGALNGVTALWRARCNLSRSTTFKGPWTEATDFFKLRNVSLSYDLPQRLLPMARSATLTLSGRNLHTWTNYSGTDPELNEGVDQYRVLGRRDYYQFPQYRTFLASMRVVF